MIVLISDHGVVRIETKNSDFPEKSGDGNECCKLKINAATACPDRTWCQFDPSVDGIPDASTRSRRLKDRDSTTPGRRFRAVWNGGRQISPDGGRS